MNREHNFKFFSHTKCEYFPCHKTENPHEFNCLFCYCPLYMMGENCPGKYTYTDKGIKNCTKCLFPHEKNSYDIITESLKRFNYYEDFEN